MRLAAWAIFGSLFINLAFGAIVTEAYVSARPLAATLLSCTHRHASGSPHRATGTQYLAGLRMGWTVG